MEAKKRFDYNINIEYALRQILGRKYSNFAGDAANPTNLKRAMKEWTLKVRKRVDDLTNYDENLKEAIDNHLNALEREVNKINKETMIEYNFRINVYDWQFIRL